MSWPLMLYWTVSPGDLRPRLLDGVEVDGGLGNDFYTARTPSAGPGRPPSLLVLFFSPRPAFGGGGGFQEQNPSSKNALRLLESDPGRGVQRVAAKTEEIVELAV